MTAEDLAHLERYEQASTNLAAKPGKRSKLEQLELDAVNAQADDLRAEIVEYEQLRNGEQVSFPADSLAELATVLVKARIARGWTQRQLAEALGMAEQQIQRYEANDYRSTSLARLCDIADARPLRLHSCRPRCSDRSGPVMRFASTARFPIHLHTRR